MYMLICCLVLVARCSNERGPILQRLIHFRLSFAIQTEICASARMTKKLSHIDVILPPRFEDRRGLNFEVIDLESVTLIGPALGHLLIVLIFELEGREAVFDAVPVIVHARHARTRLEVIVPIDFVRVRLNGPAIDEKTPPNRIQRKVARQHHNPIQLILQRPTLQPRSIGRKGCVRPFS